MAAIVGISFTGLQITPRSAFATLSGLKPGAVYYYCLVGVNETGTTCRLDATFTAR